jgi:predicted RNA-binding Zn ribbon-like protein
MAPGGLGLVHAFLNTVVADGSRERFDTPERVRDWLAKRSLIEAATPVSRDDFAMLRALRGQLRAVLGSDAPAAGRFDAVNALVGRAPLVLRFDATGLPGLVPGASGVRGAMATLLAAIATARADGTWSRLKQCRNPGCQRIYYDVSKNRSAVWCSPRRCGNRMAARAYRARAAAVTR